MCESWVATSILFFACLSAFPSPRFAGTAKCEDRKRASDGVTTGWVLTYDNPDPDRSWERIPGTLVIARKGKVVRRWEIITVRNWLFWHGGREVAIEAGGLHFETECYLASVKTGRRVASFPGVCGEAGSKAPAWVKALEGVE